MKPTLLFFLLFGCCSYVIAEEEPILVSEQTHKIGSQKDLYYSFAKGDEIIFDLKVLKGKHLKEIEVIEYPSSPRFHDFKVKNVKDQRIKVNKTGVYRFRLKGGILKKLCRIKIFRIPPSADLRDFDTSIQWAERRDSSYTTKYKRELIGVDTVEVLVIDRTERVHSQTHLSQSNQARIDVQLPANQKTKLQETELISWAYWIGVGNEGKTAMEKEKKALISKGMSYLTTTGNPVAGLALGAFAFSYQPPDGDNVKYWLKTYYDGQAYVLDRGNGIVGSGRHTDITQGGFTITLENDNVMNGINVQVNIMAIQLVRKYANKPYQELKVRTSKYPILGSPLSK